MYRPAHRLIFIALSTACLAGSPARADDLQNQVVAVAAATRANMYSFRRTVTINSNLAKPKVYIEQFDPRQPAGNQWTLISVDGHAPSAREADNARNSARDPFPPYVAVAKWFGGPATRSETAPNYATYQFASLLPGTLKFGSHDASPDTQAEAVVNRAGSAPFIEQVHMTSTKGFNTMMVASLKSLTFTMRYRQMPDGSVVPVDALSDITGSAMGKSGQMHTTATFSDFQAVQ
jgi:hypothetical protein